MTTPADTASLFRCPTCRGSLRATGDRDFFCDGCAEAVPRPDGVYDLVAKRRQGDERQHYDGVYQQRARPDVQQPLSDLRGEWTHRGWPERQRLLDILGDLRGKRVLLLGNGDSPRELMLLQREPELLVYTDLSPHGLARVRDRFDLRGHENRIVFASMDAMDLPLADGAFDIVYGYAFVHHLPDLDAFFAGVARVLKPGGRAIFMDDAYAPLWVWSKRTLFKRAVANTHRWEGISPEDYRFQLTGGFKEEDLGPRITNAGGTPWFERMRSIHYAWMRGTYALFPTGIGAFARGNTAAGFVLGIDRLVAAIPGMYRNQIRLVWGFDKPA